MNKKVICWILLFLWAGVIFYFSAQQAAESDNSSITFSYSFFSFFAFFNHLSEDAKMQFIQELHAIIRTLAHFGIFGVFGALATMTAKCYTESIKKAALYACLGSLLYAISDELHQKFVPGRSFQFSDIAVDFCGAVLGCAFICLMIWVIGLFKFVKKNMFEGS